MFPGMLYTFDSLIQVHTLFCFLANLLFLMYNYEFCFDRCETNVRKYFLRHWFHTVRNVRGKQTSTIFILYFSLIVVTVKHAYIITSFKKYHVIQNWIIRDYNAISKNNSQLHCIYMHIALHISIIYRLRDIQPPLISQTHNPYHFKP